MGGLVFSLLRPVLKLVLYAAAVYLVTFLPAFVYTHLRPHADHTPRVVESSARPCGWRRGSGRRGSKPTAAGPTAAGPTAGVERTA
jgi:hypothetical protein